MPGILFSIATIAYFFLPLFSVLAMLVVGLIVIVLIVVIVAGIVAMVQSHNKNKRLQLIKEDEEKSTDFDRSVFIGDDRLKIYYDNGQPQVKELLKEAFALFASRTEFVESVSPLRYRLFQVADMFCTLELMQMKLETEHHLSDSEMAFFNGLQNLRKNYLKPMAKKRWLEQS